MLKGVPAADKTGMLCKYHYSICCDGYPAFDLFPTGYRCKLSENEESLKIHWFDDS